MTDATDAPTGSDPGAAAPASTAGGPAPSGSRGVRRGPLIVGAIVVVVAVVVVAVVALGGSTKPKPKPVAVSSAVLADAVKSAFGTGAITVSLSLAVAEGSTQVTLTGTGGWNASERAGEFTESISGSSKEFSAIGPVTELLAGKTLYLKLGPEFASLLPTPWVSTTVSDASAAKVPSSDTAALSHVGAIVNGLESVLHVEDLGAATVDGVAVTEYQSTFNTSTAIAQLKSMYPSAFAGVANPKSAANVTITADLQSQNQLRELVVDATSTSGKAESIDLSINVTSYNASVSYAAPPASQVTPLTKVLGKGGSFSSF